MESYICMKTYADEPDVYETDFYKGKTYMYKDEYMHSTENGTDVFISAEELKAYWNKTTK